MNKRGDKTYKAKNFSEQLAIGTKEDKEWLKKRVGCHCKSKKPSAFRKDMIRRWRRGVKQMLHKMLNQPEE